jgi:hypothetical protein
MEWIDHHKDIDYYWLNSEAEEERENLGKSLYKFILDFFAKT